MTEYRKRFVQFNMLLIGLVLTVMVCLVAVYMYRDYYSGLKSTMEQVVAPLKAFPNAPKSERPSEKPGGQSGTRQPRQDSQGKDILTVFYAPDTEDIHLLSPNDYFDESTLPELLKAVTSQSAQFGTLYSSHVIYYYAGNSSLYRVALASTDYITHSMLHLGLVLLAIWVGAMGCFLLVSIQLSKVAARPMEEAIGREKQFVADASHDLKTPLSVILANNSILRENPEARVGSLSRWTDSTQQAAKRMQQLIGEMLTLADVERPEAPLELTQVDIASLVMKAALELESVAYERGVALDTELPDSLLGRSSERYLQRIAASLMENAIKYEPRGGQVLVTLTRSRRHAILEVRNRSTRISQEDLPHVFDRFYRSDKSRQSKTGGHGLGLAITKEMVTKLGGTVQAGSGEDGTTFSVKLPL